MENITIILTVTIADDLRPETCRTKLSVLFLNRRGPFKIL